ncbi:unnamed protein product [Ectocarpus fasciculatus]
MATDGDRLTWSSQMVCEWCSAASVSACRVHSALDQARQPSPNNTPIALHLVPPVRSGTQFTQHAHAVPPPTCRVHLIPACQQQGDAASAPNGANPNGSSSSSSPPVTTRRRRPQQISSYSWEDYGEEVRLTFRQSAWEWAKVEAEEIGIEWGSRRFRMSIDSREYGLHTIDLQRLSGDVVGVRARKLKTRLVVALVKGGRRGSYSHRPAWSKLQAALERPSD